jgi:hypothetical protein
LFYFKGDLFWRIKKASFFSTITHAAKLTQQKIEQFGWEVVAHLPGSSDPAPSGCHLFRSLHPHLYKKHYEDFNELKSELTAIILLIDIAYLC